MFAERRLCELVIFNKGSVGRANKGTAAAFHTEIDLSFFKQVIVAKGIASRKLKRHKSEGTSADASAATDTSRRLGEMSLLFVKGEYRIVVL